MTKEKILKDYSKLTGIRFNGIFYNVNYVNTDLLCKDLEEVVEDDFEIIIGAYQLDEDNCYLEYEFTVKDILNAREVKLYQLQEI